MATDEAESVKESEPVPCVPCSATGKVVSNSGGGPHDVPCPWCEGTGTSIPGHDAQAHWASAPEDGEPRPDA